MISTKTYDRAEAEIPSGDHAEIANCCEKTPCSTPAVSIIVPAYNVAQYISRCLHSLLRQTLKEIEIIVIDDGSTDNTADKIREIAAMDARIKTIFQPNMKQGAARNRGLEIASGEYIGFVDSDDWVNDDYFEKLYLAAKKYDSDLALGTNIRIGNGKTKKRLNIEKEVFVRSLQDRIDISKQAKNPCPTNKIYRKKMLLDNNIFYPEGIFCEDKLFTMQALYYANGIVTVPEVYYYYFRNPHSTVLSRAQSRLDKNRANRLVLQFLRKKKADIRENDFFARTRTVRFFGIPLFAVKETMRAEKFYLAGIKVLEKEISGQCDYKRKRFKIFGIKCTCKSRQWLKDAENFNRERNLENLALPPLPGDKNILFVASHFVNAGGIETRLQQYVEKLQQAGWNCGILCEHNDHTFLRSLPNFTLNFDGSNFDQCLHELIDHFGFKVMEFQFKNPKILKNLDLEKLKSKVRLGCVIHNAGITNCAILNRFDYKIMVSNFLYQRHYQAVKDAVVIQNCIDSKKYENLPVWNFDRQKKAVLITRIAKDKADSIECFIEYCRKRKIDFVIAGEEMTGKPLKYRFIKKYGLDEAVFIGKVDTMEYLSKNREEILFAAGLGLVILEAGFLNFPCFCCSESDGGYYSFITKENIRLFDNFTIKGHSPVVQEKALEPEFIPENLSRYQLREYVAENRDLSGCVKKYIEVITGEC